jgi:hypothetical protein
MELSEVRPPAVQLPYPVLTAFPFRDLAGEKNEMNKTELRPRYPHLLP